MFKSIYKKISDDFCCLEQYGYTFSHKVTHNIVPSVVFENDMSAIRIGFNYESDKIYVQWFALKESLRGKMLLENVELYGKSYDEQKELVCNFLKIFLDSINN